MNTLAGRLIAIVLLCVIAWLGSAYVPSPFGTIVSVLCGVGVLILVIYLILDLIGARGPHV